MQITPSEQIPQNDREFKLRVFNLFNGVNGNLDIGSSTQTAKTGSNAYTGNLNGQWVNVANSGAANTEFSVTHNLTDSGNNPRIPSFYWYISNIAGSLYQLPNTGTAWTTTQVFLKFSGANAQLRIFLL